MTTPSQAAASVLEAVSESRSRGATPSLPATRLLPPIDMINVVVSFGQQFAKGRGDPTGNSLSLMDWEQFRLEVLPYLPRQSAERDTMLWRLLSGASIFAGDDGKSDFADECLFHAAWAVETRILSTPPRDSLDLKIFSAFLAERLRREDISPRWAAAAQLIADGIHKLDMAEAAQ